LKTNTYTATRAVEKAGVIFIIPASFFCLSTFVFTFLEAVIKNDLDFYSIIVLKPSFREGFFTQPPNL